MAELIDKEKDLTQEITEEKHSFFGYFVMHYRVAYLILSGMIIFGFIALISMPREAEPEVKIPYAVVSTVYPGGNPIDVEDLITDKLEEKIKDVENLNEFTSSSASGYSSIFVEFKAEADLQESVRKLNDAVDLAKVDLPSDAEDPVVMEVSMSDIPIVTYSLVGDYTDIELKRYADLLQKNFEAIANVSKVPIAGGIEQEVLVSVEQAALANYQLSLSQLITAINRVNWNFPVGDIKLDGYEYNVRLQGKLDDVAELNNIVVGFIGGAPVYLRDVAQISLAMKERQTLSRIGGPNLEAKNAISLQIYKNTGGNILKIIEEAQRNIADLQAKGELPADLTVLKTNDNATFVREDLARLGTNAWQTMLMILLILYVAVGWRSSLTVSIAVPSSLLLSFIVLLSMDMTLNSLVLFSLVLALGMLVDNSIVIMDGINEFREKYELRASAAALMALKTYKWPVIAGTVTTLSAFAPLFLVSGIMGEYMAVIPKTVLTVMSSSLFIALCILPALSVNFVKKLDNSSEEISKKKLFPQLSQRWHSFSEKARSMYVSLISRIIEQPALRKKALRWAIVMFFLSILLPIVGILKIEMFPPVDVDYFVINAELASGSTLEKTSVALSQAEKIVAQIPELENYVINLGSNYNMYGGSGSGTHLGYIMVNLHAKETRERKSYQITDELRPAIATLADAKFTLEELAAGPPSGAPIEIKIFGEDLKKMSALADDFEKILSDIPHLINLNKSLENSPGEFTIQLQRTKAQIYGLTAADVGLAVRQALYGTTASQVNFTGEDVDITVKYGDNHFENIDDLGNLLLTGANGQNVKLKEIAQILLESALLKIDHDNGERVISLTASLDTQGNLQTALKQFNEKVALINMPSGIRWQIGGEMEDIQKSYSEMFSSMIVAVILIILILVMQFNSFKQMLIIMFTVPMAIAGAMWGLALLGLSFSLPAFIGLVALAGVVVNNAIVLVDRINANFRKAMPTKEAIIEAGLSRMRPIYLTTATTIFGILPLALSDEMWRGLGFTLISGLLVSTILTLVFVPLLYSRFLKK